MKSGATPQDRLAKQNEIGRQRLARELVKLEKAEKSDLRMIETARHRFRSRHKNLEKLRRSSGSNAINVRMYETHNPGFCYHCTGAIKETGVVTKEQIPKDSYEFVRSILFTNDEVDPDKVLCLHLLTAHSTKWNSNDGSTVRPVTPLLDKARNTHFSGAWNNILPCYVVDTQKTDSNVKLHEDPRRKCLEDQAIRDFEEKYRQYMENNDDVNKAMSSNARHTKIALHGLEKMPTISPHVYSLLGASHELRIKQALAEGVARKKFARSTMELNGLDEKSMSFRLDDDDLSSRLTNEISNRNWTARSTRSPSRRSAIGSSFKLDQGITMLKFKRSKPSDNAGNQRDFVTIKSSFRGIREAPSKTSSTKSPFRGMFGSRPSTNSLLSTTMIPETATKKFRKCVYLNAPVRCVELRDNEYQIVPILVNYQIQALVQSALEVLERVNPEKSRRIIETARDTEQINRLLMKIETQNFVQSLFGQSLVSSPESFVVSVAAVADEIDLRFEGVLEKEIIALTLEMPSVPSLDGLIGEIRSNIFLETKNSQPNENANQAAGPTRNRLKVKTENDSKSLDKRKVPVDNKNQRCLKKATSNSEKSSSIKADELQRILGNPLVKRTSNSKTWKAAQDPGHLDADHVILRRMTNTQRILVGQMCASLKTKRINNQGLINESVPLAALIAPALSRDSIKYLTRGTVYSKVGTIQLQEDEPEDNLSVPDKLTGPLLAKIRQDIAENETKRRLKRFLKREKK